MSQSPKSTSPSSLSKASDSMSFFNHIPRHTYAPTPAPQHDQYPTWDLPMPNRQAQLSSIWRKADSFLSDESIQNSFNESVFLPKSLESLVLDDRDDDTDASAFALDDTDSPKRASLLDGFSSVYGAIGDRRSELSATVSEPCHRR
jgi:hypothetical protein